MAAGSVQHRQDGPVVTIAINRPKVHNCVDGDTAERLRRAWLRTFNSGFDLTAVDTLGPRDTFDPNGVA